MRHSPVTWAGLRAEMERFVEEQRARQANDNEADARATRFAESLQAAAMGLGGGFEHATRKADHVEELRRVLGTLLDILADWEMALTRPGR